MVLNNLTDAEKLVESMVEIAVRRKTRLAAHPGKDAPLEQAAIWKPVSQYLGAWLAEQLEGG